MDELTLQWTATQEALVLPGMELAHALTWTLVHSAFVGCFAALGLSAFLRLAPPERSRLRYGACVLALLSVPLAAAWILLRELAGATFAPEAACGTWSASAMQAESGPLISLLAWGDGLRARLAPSLGPLEPWIAGAWLTLAALALLRVAGGWALLHLDAQRHLRRASPGVQAHLARLGRRIAYPRRTGVYWSSRCDVPMVVGAWRARIVVPARLRTALERGELDQVLLHELAHVRRGDGWMRLVEACIQALFVAHPAVHWIGARLRREREHCCDDVALRAGGDRLGYVRTLAALELSRGRGERGFWRGAATVAPSLGATDGPLVERIRRLTSRTPARPRSRVALACCGLLLGGTGLALGAVPTRDPMLRFEVALAAGDVGVPAQLAHLAGQAGDFRVARHVFVAGAPGMAPKAARVVLVSDDVDVLRLRDLGQDLPRVRGKLVVARPGTRR